MGLFENIHSKVWEQREENFLVEVKVWKSSFDGEIVNRWNVYAYIWDNHPIFKEIKKDNLFDSTARELPLHHGPSKSDWSFDEDGKCYNKKIGSDYQHLHDDYEKVDSKEGAFQIFEDAEELHGYLLNYKSKELSE